MSPADVTASRAGHVAIAIDGPAASGKSSTAHWVATELGFRHVDSGALYRAATAAALRGSVPPESWSAHDVLAHVARVSLEPRATSFAPQVNGESVDEEIRGAEVTRLVSRVAQMPAVREWVNARVRDVARAHDVVCDGRDMGTAVFPDA
ncbi:MAG: (d)CMP kinase, partial [Gemmatimonadaceae bacterium]